VLAGAGTDELEANVSKGSVQRLTLTKNITIKPPRYKGEGTAHGSGNLMEPGQLVTYILTQDATGGWTVTWDAVFKDTGGFPNRRTKNTKSVYTFITISSSELQLISVVIPT